MDSIYEAVVLMQVVDSEILNYNKGSEEWVPTELGY